MSPSWRGGGGASVIDYVMSCHVLLPHIHHILVTPIPLTTLPLEAVGGPVGALDELGVKLEALAAWAMVEGNVAEVEANVSCLLP